MVFDIPSVVLAQGARIEIVFASPRLRQKGGGGSGEDAGEVTA